MQYEGRLCSQSICSRRGHYPIIHQERTRTATPPPPKEDQPGMKPCLSVKEAPVPVKKDCPRRRLIPLAPLTLLYPRWRRNMDGSRGRQASPLEGDGQNLHETAGVASSYSTRFLIFPFEPTKEYFSLRSKFHQRSVE